MKKTQPPIPSGWIVLGFLLLPITALLVWANYTLLVLGLEAAFGFKRLEWQVLGLVLTAEDVVAVVWLLAELLAGFFLAELLGWVDLLDFDDRLEARPRPRLAGFVGVLFVALIAGEVGIGLFRQWRIEEDARRREQAVHALTAPTARTALPAVPSTVDLNRSPEENTAGARATSPDTGATPAADARPTSGWARFVQSLPSAGIALVHTAVPCFSALGGVFVTPLFVFLAGVLLTLFSVVPLTLAIIPLDLVNGALRAFSSLLVALMRLLAAPARLLIEAIHTLRR